MLQATLEMKIQVMVVVMMTGQAQVLELVQVAELDKLLQIHKKKF
jgi:hypothetical protein